MNTIVVPLHLVLVLSTAIIITARPNIPQYERIRKYRYSVGEGSPSETSQEPLLSSATLKTTTTLLSTSTQSDDYHQQQLYKFSSSSSNINHISYDDFIHLTSQEKDGKEVSAQNDEDDDQQHHHHLTKYIHEESSTSTQSQSRDNHTYINKLHRTFLRIPTTISATKVILESEEFNEDHLYESYIYS